MRKRDELTNPASCMSRAGEEEWTFVLLGRDRAAPAAVRAWIEERVRLGKNQRTDPQIVEAEQWITAVLEEQRKAPTSPPKDGTEQGLKAGWLYRVSSGPLEGELVRFWFINSSGNADCRFSKDGEIVVVRPDNLTPAMESPTPSQRDEVG